MHKSIRMLLKCHFSSFSYFFLIDSIAYQLKQLLRYFSHRTTLLRYSTPFSALLSANWKEQRFWLSTVLQCSNSTPFEATLHTCSSHKTHVLFFAYDSCLPDAHRILVNLASGDSRPPGQKFLPNFFCPDLLWLELRLLFMTCRACRNMYPQNITVRVYGTQTFLLTQSTYFMHSTNKKQNTKKEKRFMDGVSCSTSQNSKETRGNAVTQPIPFKNIEFRDGMGLRLGDDIPLFLYWFERWSMTCHP